MKSEEAKLRIKELIDKYTQLAEEKRIGGYNEELTKKDFILPLFEALGWNVYNNPNKTDSVSAEERISKKRVDYGFKINGIPKFFLEAKAIPVDLNKTKFAEQAINYSWHKGCTWAVLTDFEGIKVFNAEWKSKTVRDNLFLNLIWSDYLDRFDTLWLLSKESFEKDLLDKEAELFGKKSKKIPVDKQLLADFTRFREMLSKDITRLNQDKGLTEEELDESVQRVLDRLIFIRNCEDRELEARELMPALREWENVGKKGQLLKQLRAVFNYFNDQYNSKLFQKHLCDSLDISDIVLNEVVNGLYQTKDKAVYYDFSAIEADVLGNIYEQYLGHILRKTAKRAKVTESHARRKEQGIYYTPSYIVDYIVRNTLGELLKRKRPKEVEKIRVLDPACGSGSFLIKSFDILNEYWREKDKNYAQAQLDTTGQGTTFTRKAKILQNNIFGVDLDKQAVEIAQLNLLLKIAEKGHRLPLLQQNIKIGNSLIDNPEVAGDKAFKWEEEFEQIMDEGGFDVAIGNPPYVFSRNFIPTLYKEYFSKNYETFEYQPDLYITFLERAIKLAKPGGYIGVIVPNAWFGNLRTEKIRKFILENTTIITVIYCPKETFNIGVETAVLIFQKKKYKQSKKGVMVYGYDRAINLVEYGSVLQSSLMANKDGKLNFRLTEGIFNLILKIERSIKPLIEFCDITRGINAYDKYRGQSADVIKNRKYHSDHKVDDSYLPELKGKNVGRYLYSWGGKSWIKYGEWLAAPRDPKYFTGERIILRQIPSKRLVATIIKEDFCIDQTVFIAKPKQIALPLNYLLGIINSGLMAYYFKYRNEELDEVFPKVKLEQFKNLPIKIVPKDQQQIIELVDKMLSLNNSLNELGDKKTDERARIEKEIKKTDKEIDELVYKIYGITDEEKKIIEGEGK